MRHLIRMAAVALLLPLVAAAQEARPDDPIAAFSPQQLHEAIRESDAALFGAAFETCDLEALELLVADDLEFYHDIGGFNARSGKEFIDGIARGCEARASPDAWRSRRELVEGSMRVYPVPGYGAIQVGEHRFHERQGEGPEKHVGTAEFSHVWRYEDGRWRLARVLSYAHR